MDFQRQMLAELMNPLIPNPGKSFKDKEICKNYLVKFCPNELFTNTKVDLGPCPLIHDESLQKIYQTSNDKGKLGYEREFSHRLENLVRDMDRNVRRAKERVNAKPSEDLYRKSRDDLQEKIILVEKLISELLKKIEMCGEHGLVSEALQHLEKRESMQEELDSLVANLKYRENAGMEKKMGVCDICGAFILLLDGREDAHFEGKQHRGYQLMRETLEEMRDHGRGGRGDDYHRDRDRDRGHYRRDSRDYDRDSRDNHRRDSRDKGRSQYDKHRDDYRRRRESRSPRR